MMLKPAFVMGLFATIVLLHSPATSISIPAQGTLISNGSTVNKNEFPYIVRFYVHLPQNEERFCLGSLIALDHVLTTATCVVDHDRNVSVVAGDHLLIQGDGNEQYATSRKIIVHEHFDQKTRQNNVALLILESNLNQTSAVSPISLPTNAGCQGTDCETVRGVAAGWGIPGFYEVGDLSDVLLKANLTGSACSPSQVTPFQSSNNMCATVFRGYQGDMGGPFISEQNVDVINAMLSYTGTFNASGPPASLRTGVYIQVFPFVEWIRKNGELPDPTTTTPALGDTGGGATLVSLPLGLSLMLMTFSLKLLMNMDI